MLEDDDDEADDEDEEHGVNRLITAFEVVQLRHIWKFPVVVVPQLPTVQTSSSHVALAVLPLIATALRRANFLISLHDDKEVEEDELTKVLVDTTERALSSLVIPFVMKVVVNEFQSLQTYVEAVDEAAPLLKVRLVPFTLTSA